MNLFLRKQTSISIMLFMMIFVSITSANAQMRQIYLDPDQDNHLLDMSFYTPAEGYVAFQRWVGFTADSGKTYTKKYVTLSNVNFNGYSVNLTFGFTINGLKAFSQNNLLVYGDYGFVPAILRSIDGGNSFTLIYHSQYDPMQLRTGITDMIFPQNNNIGYAVDADRILKTINQGLSWSVVKIDEGRYYNHLEAVDNNYVIAMSTGYTTNRVERSTNGGTTWQTIFTPTGLQDGKITYVYFLNSSLGWISMYDHGNNKYYFYKTTNGGSSWTFTNNPDAVSFGCNQMKFIDANTGYALAEQNTVYKTTNAGAIWERLPRDNNYTYLGFTHNALSVISSNQLWAGGGHGFLELSNNGGGTPLPGAYFLLDTVGVSATSNVNLVNYSLPGYTYKWFLNDVQISTSYNANYVHDVNRIKDTVTLVVSNGLNTDTLTRYQNFHPPVIINSFTPTLAGNGYTVTITGQNFTGANAVRFGDVHATSFIVQSSTTITAVVGNGASGSVTVNTPTGMGTLAGFTFLPPPTITSFSPTDATAGTSVTISGTNFNSASAVSFGGIAATSFVVVSPSTITAIVPSGASGLISVTTPGGTTTAPGYIALPSITSFTPTSGTFGTILNIAGSSLTGITSVTVGGIPVSSFTVHSSTSISAVVSTGATGNVTVTKTGGSASLPGFSWISPPTISSFSPMSGPAGTSVTITGTGFHPVFSNNTVYFGSMKAQITAGNSTSLTVIVPSGATYQPISITSNNLIAYSNSPFLLTFPNGGSITSASFASTTSINLPLNNQSNHLLIADIDDDGKNDLLITHSGSIVIENGVFIYRNISTGNAITFADPIALNQLDNIESAVGDLNGDGKLDLAVIKEASIVTFLNTSIPGTISFVESTPITAVDNYRNIIIDDIDQDGKADIVSNKSGTINGTGTFVYRNISEPATITFDVPVKISGGASEQNIISTDIDGDKKPDLIVSGEGILRNNSTPGNIQFSPAVTFPFYLHSYLSSGDIDGDGMSDLVLGDLIGSRIVISRNTSTIGNISLAPPIDFNATDDPSWVAVTDLDGDGKVDIATGTINFSLSVLKNLSTPGNVLLAPKIDYLPGNYSGRHLVALADLSGDGKPDAVGVRFSGITIHQNTVVAEPFVQAFTPTMGVAGTTVSISGFNFTGVTAVSFGGVPAASFTVNSPTNITAIVGTGATGDVVVTNNLGSGTLSEFIYGAPPVITSFSPTSGPVGTTVTITGLNFDPEASNNIVYFGGMKAVVNSATPTSLNVTVPFGSLHSNITVTNNNLTGYSSAHYLTTFPNGAALSISSFAPRYDKYGAGKGTVTDLDGDGMLDLLIGGKVARNTSTSGNFSFAPDVSLVPDVIHNISGDMDNDGKPDVVYYTSNTLSIAKNTSTPGNFSVVSGVSVTVPVTAIDVEDIDGDGKTDILIGHYSSLNMSVFRNISTPGNLSLAPKVDYSLYSYPLSVELHDLNADRKPEMVGTHVGPSHFTVFTNTSTPGNISFGPAISVGDIAGSTAIGDIDNDGKPEVLVINGTQIRIYRNTSPTGGAISFDPAFLLSSGPSATNMNLSLNDYDGDGKLDIILNKPTTNIFTAIKNNSTPGNFSFNAYFDLPLSPNPNYTVGADMDNDGKPDIIAFQNQTTYPTTSIYRNISCGTGPEILEFIPVSGIAGTTVTITGNNFTGTTSVKFGNSPAASFVVVSANMITAVVGSGASGSVTVTTTEGLGSLTGFIYGTAPVITSVMPMFALAGTTVEITGANLSSVSSVTFGGMAAASYVINSSTSITAIVGTSGASGSVTVSDATGSSSIPGFVFAIPPQITSFTPTSGGGGGTITINGSGFTGATEVLFGNVTASGFTVVSPNQITASVGGGSSGDVTVITPGGSASLGVFTYAGPAQFLTYFPNAGTSGTEVIITGNNLTHVTDIKFGGTSAASFVVNSPQSITAVVGSGSSGTVQLIHSNNSPSLPGFTYIPASSPGITAINPSIGYTGNSITITGMNFTGATMVSFGGIPASSFIVNSPTSITAIIGSGTSGNVSVSTPGGTATLPGFIYSTQPVITSFSPESGSVGSAVTITGSNFNPIAANNTVYFGTAKAIITSATSTTLTVSVPQGATYMPISVTSANLSGYSSKSFLPTFPFAGALNSNTFASRLDSITGSNPQSVTLADIDFDGSLDALVTNRSGGTASLAFYKNAGSPGTIAFAPKVTHPGTYGPQKISYADFNGDGRLDIATANGSDGNAVNIYQNNSTPGNISFSNGPLLTAGIGGFNNATADIDGDGKPDVMCSGGWGGGISVYRNTSTVSSLSFAPRITFVLTNIVNGIAVEDMDLDGKPDIIVPSLNTISVMRNISTVGNIAFNITNYSFNGFIMGKIRTGDMDGDGKADIVVCNKFGSTGPSYVSIFKNTSIPGLIQFEPRKNFPSTTSTVSSSTGFLDLGDMDGNGKPDVVVTDGYDNTVSVFSNNSTPGNISLEPRIIYPTNSQAFFVTVGDLDKDGKPDIAAVNPSSNTMTIFRNQLSSTNIVQVCINGSAAITSNLSGTSYQWQQNTGTGFVNISNNSNFSGTTTATLQLSNIPATWNNYEFKCIVNGNQSSLVYKLSMLPPLTASVSISTATSTICSGATVSFTATAVNGGSTPGYQWKVNGINAGTNSAIFTTSSLTNGDQVSVEMTGSNPCATPLTTSSNVISVTVSSITPSVSISASATTICTGNSITFTATPVNGGTPTYQWQVNGVNTGSNSPVFTTSSLLDGSQVKVIMSSSVTCANPAITTSNVITVSVSGIVPPEVSIVASANDVCAGSSVTFTASPVNGGSSPDYQWQINGINTGTNNSVFTTSALSNGDQVAVIMTSSSSCATTSTAISNHIVMNVNNSVTPSVSISASASSICAGATVTFTATPVNEGTSPSYQWKVNGINAGTNSPAFTSAILANSDEITVEMTSSAACAMPLNVTSNVITMSVISITPSVSITATSNSICVGDNVTFTATPVNGGVPAYQWRVNGINAGTNSPVFSTTSLVNGSQVDVSMTSSEICASPAIVTSNSITVSVSGLVPPEVSVVASATNICAGSLVTFTATPVNGGATPTYQWQVNGINEGTNSPVFTTTNLISGSQVIVKMTSSSSCATVPQAESSPITVTVNDIVTPSVTVVSSATEICPGENITFTASPIHGGSSPFYQWTVNGINAGANEPVFTSTNLTDGSQVKVEMTSSASCVTSTLAISNPIHVTVVTTIPSITISGNTTVSANTATTIVSNVMNAGSNPLYQWQDSTAIHNWQDIQGATNQSLNYIPEDAGDKIRCVLTGNAPCTMLPVISNTLTFDLTARGMNIVFYPNPVTSSITIDSLDLTEQWENLSISAITGNRNIITRNISGQNRVTINVQPLASGMYFIILRRQDGEKKYLKFIKL